MFTLKQIKAAHSKVKSGADFPKYIADIKKLAVNAFETSVLTAISNILVKAATKLNLSRCMKI